jgi:ribosomal protein S18 acetylase RimI-like enzyme
LRTAEPGLDNPVWSCLATRHAHFAIGGPLALRYPRDVSPLAALSGSTPAHAAALAALVDVGDDVALGGPHVPPLPSGFETFHESEVTQMVRPDAAPLPERDVAISPLGAADAPEMLALVERTQPGPFRQRTVELGAFLGIREGGRLVAMAGERLWIGGFHEVSGVCTDPDARGRGYAMALIACVVNRMLRAGETPFLHVESWNAGAIALYLRLGFERRARFPLVAAKRLR